MKTYFQNPERDYIYQLITSYYDNPNMIKIRDMNDLSMYAIQIPCLLMNEKRYIIALSPINNETIGHKKPLQEIRWKAFMSRALNDETLQSIPKQSYSIKREDKFLIPLKIENRSRQISEYNSTIPHFHVSLLHLKNQEFEYPNEGNLVSALETFQTILTWKD